MSTRRTLEVVHESPGVVTLDIGALRYGRGHSLQVLAIVPIIREGAVGGSGALSTMLKYDGHDTCT